MKSTNTNKAETKVIISRAEYDEIMQKANQTDILKKSLDKYSQQIATNKKIPLTSESTFFGMGRCTRNVFLAIGKDFYPDTMIYETKLPYHNTAMTMYRVDKKYKKMYFKIIRLQDNKKSSGSSFQIIINNKEKESYNLYEFNKHTEIQTNITDAETIELRFSTKFENITYAITEGFFE